jgi:hypothetical protein
MATVDDGIVNLRRFVAALATATAALEEIGEHIEGSAQKLVELEAYASEEGGELNEQLAELGSALDRERGEACDGLNQATRAAIEAQGTVGQSIDRLGGAAAEVETRAQSALAEIDKAHAELSERGFTDLARTVEDLEQAMEAEVRELDQAFDELKSAVDRVEGESQTTWDAADAEVDQSTADVGEVQTALENQTADSVSGLEAEAGQLEAFCTTLAGDVDLIYDVLDAGVHTAGQQWEQHAFQLGQESTRAIQAAEKEQLQQPLLALQGPFAELDQTLSSLGTLLQVATEVGHELSPLAEELAKCQQVVGQIDKLLNALAE